jgi:hypothetical protein
MMPNVQAATIFLPSGFVYMGVYDERHCSDPDITMGFPVNTCFVESSFSFKFQLVEGISNCCSILDFSALPVICHLSDAKQFFSQTDAKILLSNIIAIENAKN